jgi:hypothetical protein
MAEVTLEYSCVKTVSDPKERGCLIIGNVLNLSLVTFDSFAEKLQPSVDRKVSKQTNISGILKYFIK